MKKISLILVMLLFSVAMFGQNKRIARFKTTHTKGDVGSTELKVRFKFYEDSLVMKMLDRDIKNLFKESGTPNTVAITGDFKKVENDMATWYTLKKNDVEVIVITKPKYLVKMRGKNRDLNSIATQIFYRK